MTTEQSSWELTKQHSGYHFDNFKFDPDQDKVTTLGNIDPFWKEELDTIIELAKPKTWRTRGKEGNERPGAEYDQEDYDLEQFGYGKDHIVSDLSWEVPDAFNKIAVWFGMDNCKMRLHVQRPGQIWNLHLDKLEKWNPEDPGKVMRVMIALNDWEPGHFWSYGNYMHSRWHAGDVTTFDWQNLPHATANAGHEPRITLQMTGVVTDQTREFLRVLRSKSPYRI
jgi:hypothetical protein